MAVGATTATLQSATDDDGVALPAGTYYFAIDGNNSQKEHIQATLSGVSLTNIKSVSRQGALTIGVVRTHRVGSTVTLTDFAHIRYINDLLTGATDLDSTAPLKYDGTATISDAKHLATKKYVDDTAVAGAPNASTTIKGIVEEATQAETDARTASGGTGAELYINPTTLRATKFSDPLASGGSANAYTLTVAPAITAYSAGQVFGFIANFANTGSATLNVSGLGAKTIKKHDGATNLVSGDIANGQAVTVMYDGTNMVMQSPVANNVSLSASAYPAGDGSAITNVATGKIAVANSTVTVISTTAETTLFTMTVPANSLSTANAIALKVFLSSFAVTVGQSATFRLKYGGTTIASLVYTAASANNGRPAVLEGLVLATGATNSQLGYLNLLATTDAFANINNAGNSTGAIDSTASQTLLVSVQFSNSSGSDTAVLKAGTAHLIK